MPGFNIVGAVAGTPSNTVETSRRNRYKLVFPEASSRVLALYAHKSGRPSPEIDPITMHQGQDEIYWPGKNRWQPLEMTFYQALDSGTTDDVVAAIYNWWATTVVLLASSRINTTFKRNCELQLVNGFDQPIWDYKIYGAWPQKITPDVLDYSESSIAEITLILKFDKCEEVPMNGSTTRTTSSCGGGAGAAAAPPAAAPSGAVGSGVAAGSLSSLSPDNPFLNGTGS